MLREYPEAELAPDFGLADALNDLDVRIAQDERACAVHTRVRVVHSDHDLGDAALGDGFRASRCAAVEGTRLKGGVECRADDTVPLHVSVARRGDFRVIFTGAKRMATPQELAANVHDHATHPRVVTRSPTCKLRLFDREAHPALMLVNDCIRMHDSP